MKPFFLHEVTELDYCDLVALSTDHTPILTTPQSPHQAHQTHNSHTSAHNIHPHITHTHLHTTHTSAYRARTHTHAYFHITSCMNQHNTRTPIFTLGHYSVHAFHHYLKVAFPSNHLHLWKYCKETARETPWQSKNN